jgi:hypothetical protein
MNEVDEASAIAVVEARFSEVDEITPIWAARSDVCTWRDLRDAMVAVSSSDIIVVEALVELARAN